MTRERSEAEQEVLGKLAGQPAGMTLVELSRGKSSTKSVRQILAALEQEELVCEYHGAWFLGSY